VVVVVVVVIFFLDSKRENKIEAWKKQKLEFIVSLTDLLVGGRMSEFFSFSKLDSKRTQSLQHTHQLFD